MLSVKRKNKQLHRVIVDRQAIHNRYEHNVGTYLSVSVALSAKIRARVEKFSSTRSRSYSDTYEYTVGLLT